MKICSFCGHPLEENSRFCGQCGHAPAQDPSAPIIIQTPKVVPLEKDALEKIIQKPKSATSTKHTHRKTHILWVCIAVAAVLIAAVIMIATNLSKNKALPTKAPSEQRPVSTVATSKINTVATEETYSGQCGEDVLWSLNNETGALTISGTGQMDDYRAEPGSRAPWHPHYSTIKSVTITDGVTRIGSYAFFELTKLEQVQIADTITFIAEGAFDYCSALTQITIPKNVNSISPHFAFSNCHQLERISVVPANETFTDEDGILFSKDKTILIQMPSANGKTTYTVPDTVTQISSRAFSQCETLTQITLPQGLTTIGEAAFSRCSALESIQIPDGVTTLEYMTFESCTSLQEIHIPKSVTVIEDSVFSMNSSLTTIHYADSWAQWETISIGSGNESLLAATVNTVESKPATGASIPTAPSVPTSNATQFSEYCVDLLYSSGVLSWNVGTASSPSYEGIRLSSGCTIWVKGTLVHGESGFQAYRASAGSVDGLMIAVDYNNDGYYDLIEIM